MIQHLWLFVAAELFFSATPGPAVMMVSAAGIRGGMRDALAASLGIQTGNFIYILVSALGIGALIAASGTAFAIIKYAGAAYLIFLGTSSLWRARVAQTNPPRAATRPYVQGMLTQLANPKAILYFSAFLPQFLSRDAPLWPQYALMFAIIAVGETSILGFYGWLAAHGARLAGERFGLWRERVSGALLVAVGILFATRT